MSPVPPGNGFTVHTGNLNNCLELVTRRHKNSSAEICAAFKHIASQDSLFRATDGVYSPTTEALQHAQTDVKTTLKVCLASFSAEDVREAVRVTLETLQLGMLSQLIVSFPYDESVDLTDDDWLEKVSSIWASVEELVEKDIVHTIGVSDLDVDRLRLLYDTAKEHPPTIDHYSIDGCCTVPSELVEYAKSHDIQLLTHNDPRSLNLDDEVLQSAAKITGLGKELVTKWAARYTVWIRSRSVMAAKGYFVHFTTN